jgi:hypothetical protein
MNGRKTNIEPTYRVSIPGTLLPHSENAEWHPFLMSAGELLELHQAIRDALGLTETPGLGGTQ